MKFLLIIVNLILAAVLVLIIEYPVIKSRKIVDGTVTYTPTLTALPLFVAKEEGFFDSTKVNVKMVEAGINGNEVDDVKNGTYIAAFGTDWSNFVYKGAIKPDAFKIMYSTFSSIDMPYTALYGNPRIAYKGIKDLKGKRIGYSSLTKDNKWVRYIYLQYGGKNKNDLTLLSLGVNEMDSAIIKKNVDFIVAREPEKSILGLDKRHNKLDENAFLEQYVQAPFPVGVGYTSIACLQFFPEPTKRISRAILMAVKYMRNHPDVASNIAHKYLNIDSTVTNFNVPSFKIMDEIDPSEITKTTDMMLKSEITLKEADFSRSILKPQEIK